MSRYVRKSVDPQTKRAMISYSKQTGEELAPYTVVNINDLFIAAGRVDLLSRILYGNSKLWYFIVNKNYDYQHPFNLLEKDYDIENANGKKFIKIPILNRQNTQLGSAGKVTNVENTLDL